MATLSMVKSNSQTPALLGILIIDLRSASYRLDEVPKSRSVSSCDWYSLVDLSQISILIHHFHIDHHHDHASFLPPKVLHNHRFQFLLGITVVPTKYKENSYAKIWGVNKVYYGLCEFTPLF